ncbi:hypothetical protein [Halobellus litoreus]|jgi:hypothetical protein|uniref:Transporter n=1 Tax=Halobellus litoreus TaxID=755310 RepID=A0ABD6DU44_9EURY|nr:hypothetical protein [Halobellus litoreus]
MRTSTKVVLAGGLLFALPLPGTFITGALVAAVGGVLRFLGE